MGRIKNRRLSVAFLLPIILTIFVVLMLATVNDAVSNRNQSEIELKNSAVEALTMASAASQDAFWTFNDVAIKEVGIELFSYKSIASVRFVDELGDVVYENAKTAQPYTKEYLYPKLQRKILHEEDPIGQIEVIYTSYYLQQELRTEILRGIVRTILLILLISIVIVLMSRNITMSLDKVVAGIRAFSAGDQDHRIKVKSSDEIEQMADRINRMFDTIVAAKAEQAENFERLKRQEEQLRVAEERYRYAVDGSNDAIWDWNLVSGEFFVSHRGIQMVGMSEIKDLNLETWTSFIYPADQEQFKSYLHTFYDKATNFGQLQFRVMGNHAEIRWIFSRGKGIYDQEGSLIRVSGFFTDITERIQSEEAINRLAYYDTLTGLPNRAMLYDRLNKLFIEQIHKNSQSALLYMDLDDFKTINDVRGHMIGDKVLVHIAEELVREIECDAIARVGGDEFVFIQKDCDEMSAILLANEILNIMNRTWLVEGYSFTIGCSIGITMYPKDGTDIDKLMMNADSAMYSAKSHGKGQFEFYEKSISDSMVKKIELQNEIRQGIANHEFVLFYQPQVDLETGYIHGVEALVRWNHPKKGILPPAAFIAIAEESELILPLGEQILKTACEQSVKWEMAGIKDLSVGVNMSAKQFRKKGLLQDVIHILQETGMRAELLDIEITESTAMEDVATTIAIMESLKERGIKFSLDDFGTGYSSLNYLISLPIDYLKIDKHFVQSLKEDSFEEVVIKAIIEIAHNMKLTVIAEGIETLEQNEILKKFNGNQAQGYYYSKPLSVEDIEPVLTSRYYNTEL